MTLIVKHDIFRFKISIYDILFMEIFESKEDLGGIYHGLFLRKGNFSHQMMAKVFIRAVV
jgi:hypothetical protein